MTTMGMTVLDLIRALLGEPMDAQVYIGKGTGPLRAAERIRRPDGVFLVLEPDTSRMRGDIPS
jgi:hypothetical protein